jgi:hypothetical protein
MAFAGKEQETHGKHFAVRFSRKRTANSTRHLFTFYTVNRLCRALMLTHGKLIPEHIKKSLCA